MVVYSALVPQEYEANSNTDTAWSWSDTPAFARNPTPELTIQDFPIKPLDGIKTLNNLYDVVKAYTGEINEDRVLPKIVDLVKGGQLEWWRDGSIPDILKPAGGGVLPAGSFVQVVLSRNGDDSVDIVRHMIMGSPVKACVATKLCHGQAGAPFWKQNAWGVKKAYQALLSKLPGAHLMQASVLLRTEAKEKSQRWAPTREESRAGIAFINKNCPPGYEPNEVLAWALEHVHNDSPIKGWPLHIVEKACGNVLKVSNSDTDSQFFSPLVATNVADFKRVLVSVVLPLILAVGRSSGLLLLGRPGVGKTPWVMSLAMMFGRYHMKQLQRQRRAAFRRGKMFDVFRQKPPP